VARYVGHAQRAIADIRARGKPVFVVGGTPLYLKALTEGLFEGPGADPATRARLQKEAEKEGSAALHRRLATIDPQAAERIHPNDLRRITRALEVYELSGQPISDLQAQWDRGRTRYDYVLLGLRWSREDLGRRTNERVRRMIDAGLVDEVRSLLAEPRPLSTAARQALGYAEIMQHLAGTLSLADTIEMIKINTRQFAKAQRTWFKRFRETAWIDPEPNATSATIADELMKHRGLPWSA
jgi:tRNA dimethylallyltransferase